MAASSIKNHDKASAQQGLFKYFFHPLSLAAKKVERKKLPPRLVLGQILIADSLKLLTRSARSVRSFFTLVRWNLPTHIRNGRIFLPFIISQVRHSLFLGGVEKG